MFLGYPSHDHGIPREARSRHDPRSRLRGAFPWKTIDSQDCPCEPTSISRALRRNSCAVTPIIGGPIGASTLAHPLLPPLNRRIWLGTGPSPFPVDPDASPEMAPALWSPFALPALVILDHAPVGFEGPTASHLHAIGSVLNDITLSDGRHLVLGTSDGPHHLWLRSHDGSAPPGEPSLCVAVIADGALELRQAMAVRLMRRLAGSRATRSPTPFAPSLFQRQRYNLLLALIDRQQASSPPPALHDLARNVVYPGMQLGRGKVWKGSNERRRAQRLVEEAHAHMHGGYRALLRAAPGGATKTGSSS